MVRVRVREGRLVVSQWRLWTVLLAAPLLFAAYRLLSDVRARLELRCEAGERHCVVVDRSILQERRRHVLAASEVDRIEVTNLRAPGDGEDDWCVVVATPSARHVVDRCSLVREPRLDDLAGELQAFYAGASTSVERTVDDRGILTFVTALVGLLGVGMLLSPARWRTEVDRRRGVVEVRAGIVLRHRCEVAVSEVVGVSVWGSDGARRTLVLDLVDGRRRPLGEPTVADLEAAQRAVARYLERPDAYR